MLCPPPDLTKADKLPSAESPQTKLPASVDGVWSRLPQSSAKNTILRGGQRISQYHQSITPRCAPKSGHNAETLPHRPLKLELQLELYSAWEQEISSTSRR